MVSPAGKDNIGSGSATVPIQGLNQGARLAESDIKLRTIEVAGIALKINPDLDFNTMASVLKDPIVVEQFGRIKHIINKDGFHLRSCKAWFSSSEGKIRILNLTDVDLVVDAGRSPALINFEAWGIKWGQGKPHGMEYVRNPRGTLATYPQTPQKWQNIIFFKWFTSYCFYEAVEQSPLPDHFSELKMGRVYGSIRPEPPKDINIITYHNLPINLAKKTPTP